MLLLKRNIEERNKVDKLYSTLQNNVLPYQFIYFMFHDFFFPLSLWSLIQEVIF